VAQADVGVVTMNPPERVRRRRPRRAVLLNLMRTTDHKLIGMMYLVTSFGFFLLGGCARIADEG